MSEKSDYLKFNLLQFRIESKQLTNTHKALSMLPRAAAHAAFEALCKHLKPGPAHLRVFRFFRAVSCMLF